jgi:Fe-S oxidoreductase
MKKEYKYQSINIEEYEPQFWSCQNCFCGLCVDGCPVYQELGNEAVSARGLAQIGIGILNGELDISDLSDEILYACVGCGWCEEVCSMNTPLYIKRHGNRKIRVSGTTMAEIFRSLKIDEGGKIPKGVKDALNNIFKFGNPYGGGRKLKDQWVADLGVSMDNKDTILYCGATVPYEENSTNMAEAIVNIFKFGQLDFGMLGREERDSGAFSRMMGEEGLFLEMAEHNLKIFKEHGIRKIICVSPHDFDTFKNYYEEMENIEVKHYTQVLSEMIDSGKVKILKKINKRVTYHDPCYLGRHNDIYDEPRNILNNIQGIEFIEMGQSKEKALCCGGGGSGLFLNLPNVNIDKVRADLINEVNPDYVAVACPNCYQMLDAAIKGRNYKIETKDIAQIVMEAL